MLVVVLLCSPVQSQPPSPTQAKKASNQQKKTTTKEQSGNPNNHQPQPGQITVNQYNSNPDDQGTTDTAKEKNEAASRERINTLSTELLAASTFLLFVATGALCVVAVRQWRTMQGHERALTQMGTYMSQGLAETAKAASAAGMSAKAALSTAEGFMNSERAWLIIETSEMDMTQAVFKFTNYGRTPARLTEIGLTYVVRSSPDIWPVDYSELRGVLCTSHIIAPTTSTLRYRATIKYADEVTEGGPQFRHVYGIVRYEDIFGRVHATPFYYSWQTGAWLLSGPPEANKPD
jgi:hypothetical protein